MLTLICLLLFVNVLQAQERLQVVASFSILADVTQQVAGAAADVRSLIPVGADPHTFTPTPQDLVALAQADLVLVSGVNFEEGLLEAIVNAGADMPLIVASECVMILPVGGHDDEEEEHEEGEEAQGDEGALSEDVAAASARCTAAYAELGMEMHEESEQEDAEHRSEPLGPLYALDCGGHEGEEGGSGDEHAHGSCDPHLWTNPENVMLWTLTIRDALSAADPANAAAYAANAAAYIAALRALDNEELMPLVATLPEANRVLITNHETLGYFAAHYDFELVGVVYEGGGTTGEPGAAEVAALVDTIRSTGVAAIFAETTVGDLLIQRVAEETGVIVATLYSDTLSAADEPAPTYLDYMRYNVQTIVSALTPAN
ncbi:MAG: zinc ABC transporter substrate-binding protein [Chloroflexi bacterium]|nr:zinc ABC transporter substrate-binding protein [Chloroflexota bacterium]